tara:strand:- start:2937 stop:3098 length:162 start_codon:yes stop_codon:yes gene_type:complete
MFVEDKLVQAQCKSLVEFVNRKLDWLASNKDGVPLNKFHSWQGALFMAGFLTV